MKKSFGKLVLLCSCVAILSGCVSSKREDTAERETLPWNYYSPYEDMTPEEREDAAEDAFKDYGKDQGRKVWEYAKENLRWVRRGVKKVTHIRDKHLTLRVGDVPKEEIKISEPEEQDAEEKSGFLMARPGGSGLELKARNPTHLEIRGDVGVHGAKLTLKPKIKLFGLPLPTLETGYDINDLTDGNFKGEYSVEARYRFQW